MKKLADLKDLNIDDLLGALGLETRRAPIASIALGLGCFTAGLIVGAGVVMLLKPASGRELIATLKSKVQDLKTRTHDSVGEQHPTAAAN